MGKEAIKLAVLLVVSVVILFLIEMVFTGCDSLRADDRELIEPPSPPLIVAGYLIPTEEECRRGYNEAEQALAPYRHVFDIPPCCVWDGSPNFSYGAGGWQAKDLCRRINEVRRIWWAAWCAQWKNGTPEYRFHWERELENLLCDSGERCRSPEYHQSAFKPAYGKPPQAK